MCMHNQSNISGQVKNKFLNSFVSFYFIRKQANSLIGFLNQFLSGNVFSRNSKPKNRPSFQQVLLHVEIAAGDVLKTPREMYLNQQVTKSIFFLFSGI